MNSLRENDELKKLDTVDIDFLFPFLFLTYSNTHISVEKYIIFFFKYL